MNLRVVVVTLGPGTEILELMVVFELAAVG